MREIVGAVFTSLDGVIQGPGAPNEDPTGGFELGGWLFNYFDEGVGERIGALFGEPFDLLLGRRTYDIFAAYWPFAEGDNRAIAESFDRARKYVVTRGRQELPWRNSHRVPDLDALAEVKRGEGAPLLVQGSGTLYPQLLAAGLIDRLVLMIFPVVIGSGKRLFSEGTPPRSMPMVEHQVTPGGTVIATYEPGGEVRPGSFATEEPSAAELERRARIARGEW
jgi:dihydrofolate reductase